jgi:cyclase
MITARLPGILFASASLAAIPCAAQTNYDTVKVTTVPITPTVFLLQGAGGNITVSAGNDAVFVVDAQFPPLTKKVQAAIAELTSNPVRFLVNTHWHPDHVGGNENLGKAGALSPISNLMSPLSHL